MLYPFGYGLSYSSFVYDNLILEKEEVGAGETLMVSVDVTNTGPRIGDDVVQLYVRHLDVDERQRPLDQLRGYQRVTLAPGETARIDLEAIP